MPLVLFSRTTVLGRTVGAVELLLPDELELEVSLELEEDTVEPEEESEEDDPAEDEEPVEDDDPVELQEEPMDEPVDEEELTDSTFPMAPGTLSGKARHRKS